MSGAGTERALDPKRNAAHAGVSVWKIALGVVLGFIGIAALVFAFTVWVLWDQIAAKTGRSQPDRAQTSSGRAGAIGTVAVDVTPCTTTNAAMLDLMRLGSNAPDAFSNSAIGMVADHSATILKVGDRVEIMEDFGSTVTVRPLPGNHGKLDICVLDPRALGME